jgi:hypothetical protein
MKKQTEVIKWTKQNKQTKWTCPYMHAIDQNVYVWGFLYGGVGMYVGVCLGT